MDWKVAFEARARKRLWELVTRTTVGEVSANLAARTCEPITFTLVAKLAGLPRAALDEWLEILADGDLDLGLPMPLPIVVAGGDESRKGYERLILPPGLRERVVDVRRGTDSARVDYSVVNPSWMTCYPAHTHRGVVEFSRCENKGGGGDTEMTWRVHVRPMRGGAAVVKALTSVIVPAFSRTLVARRGVGAATGESGSVVRCEWS